MSQFIAIEVTPKQQGDRLLVDGPSIYWRKRIYFSDFNAAATTTNLDVQQPSPWTKFPAGIEIEGAGLSLITAFSGGGIATYTISAGTTGAATKYIAATNVFTGATAGGATTVGAAQVPFTMLNGTAAPSAATIRVQGISTVANTNTATAGKCDIYLKLRAVSVRVS